jgi:hypothetical protein
MKFAQYRINVFSKTPVYLTQLKLLANASCNSRGTRDNIVIET